MFWDRVAWIYDLFANGINRRANRALCAAVEALIRPSDEVLECACGTGLLTGRRGAVQEPDRDGLFGKHAEARRAQMPQICQRAV